MNSRLQRHEVRLRGLPAAVNPHARCANLRRVYPTSELPPFRWPTRSGFRSSLPGQSSSGLGYARPVARSFAAGAPKAAVREGGLRV